MKRSLIAGRTKWALYCLLANIFVCSMLLLTSKPAYAGTCTAQECANAATVCSIICMQSGSQGGTVLHGTCVVGGGGFTCVCFDPHQIIGINC